METEDDYKSRKERSQYLFDVLSKAVAYKYSTSGSVRLGLEGYELREGGGVMDYTTTENIWSWLRDENRSTFLFPDNNAHPDLMFILERRRKSSNDTDGPRTGRIICALQVRDFTTMKNMSILLICSLVQAWRNRQLQKAGGSYSPG